VKFHVRSVCSRVPWWKSRAKGLLFTGDHADTVEKRSPRTLQAAGDPDTYLSSDYRGTQRAEQTGKSASGPASRVLRSDLRGPIGYRRPIESDPEVSGLSPSPQASRWPLPVQMHLPDVSPFVRFAPGALGEKSWSRFRLPALSPPPPRSGTKVTPSARSPPTVPLMGGSIRGVQLTQSGPLLRCELF